MIGTGGDYPAIEATAEDASACSAGIDLSLGRNLNLLSGEIITKSGSQQGRYSGKFFSIDIGGTLKEFNNGFMVTASCSTTASV